MRSIRFAPRSPASVKTLNCGLCRTNSFPSRYCIPNVACRFVAKTVTRPSGCRHLIEPSEASARGALMSIGSSATKRRPSGAVQTTVGWRMTGAAETSSRRQPFSGTGTSAARRQAKNRINPPARPQKTQRLGIGISQRVKRGLVIGKSFCLVSWYLLFSICRCASSRLRVLAVQPPSKNGRNTFPATGSARSRWRGMCCGHRERALPAFQRPAEGVVLDFDTNGAAITGLHQRAHEPGPIQLGTAGGARLVPLERVREDTDIVDAVPADFHVLGVEVEQPGLELAQRARRVHVLQHEMRWIVVQTEMFRRNVAEHPAPDDGRGGEVFAAGPLVACEEHRAVFDADLDAVIFGEGDERAPGFQETRPIVVHAPGPVAPDERVHVLQSELLGGEDDFLEMSDHALRCRQVGIERVRIVTKAGEADAVFRAQRIHIVGFRVGEAGDIDVRDAGELAVGLANGPAHGLDTREALRTGKSEDLFEIQLREDGGDKAEVHWSGWLSTKEHSAAEPQPKQ